MGKSYPEGKAPKYPPKRWVCPKNAGGCGKEHSKPHYAHEGQINYNYNPGREGRVTFNREGSVDFCDSYKFDTDVKEGLPKTGNQWDKDGSQRPLFCPHCGWEEEMIIIKKVKGLLKDGWKKLKQACCFRDCPEPATHENKAKGLVTCEEHYKLVK